MPESNGAVPQVTITIDGVQLQVPKGTLLVEAAKQIKREIPVYCYHTKMGPAGLCRICLVEIEGMPKLQIGCNTQAADGMVVHTQSEKAADGRRAVLEVYLKNHPLDCPICDKGGECDLQDFSMAYGQGFSRSADPKIRKPKAVDLGPTIVLDEERCVVCQRCVRFDDIIAGERQLVLKDRGVHDIIATAAGEPYRHNFTGNVTELCPVGALTSKTFRFRARPWDLHRTDTTCAQCSVGCQMHVDVRVGNVMRTMSVDTDHDVSDTWLCDRGRYNIGFYHHPDRLTQPLYRTGGQWTQIGWDDALELWATAIREAVKANPAAAGAIGGGRLTNEEAYLLQHVMRGVGIRNLDWRAGRQRQAGPGRGAARFTDLETAQAIVIVGESPAQRAPVLDLRVRKAAFQKNALLLRVASAEPRYPAAIPSRDVSRIEDAVEALGDRRRVALIWDGEDLSLGKRAYEALAGRDVLTYITGEQSNARGAEAMGMHPNFGPGYAAVEGGMDTSAMLLAAHAGDLAALSILGANPVLHAANGPFVREALSRVPFVVVSELFMTQTAELATLVLPARGPFEKTGTVTNAAGDVLPLNAAARLRSPEGALTDLEMLIGLAQQLGVDLPEARELDAAVIGHLARSPEDFTFGDDRFAMTLRSSDAASACHPEPVEGPRAKSRGISLAIQTHIFAGGGTSAHDTAIETLRPLPEVALSPEDAAELGVATGDYVDLAAEQTVMHDVLVEVRAGMPRGVIAAIGGLPDDPANCFPDGAAIAIVNVRQHEIEALLGGAAGQ